MICHTTELGRGMGLFLVWCHKLICIVWSLCKHACKEVCDVNPGIDPYPLLARSCDRWWPDFVTFTTCKKSRLGLKGGKKVQCVSNRCKDLFEGNKYFGVRCTLTHHGCLSKFQLFFLLSAQVLQKCWWPMQYLSLPLRRLEKKLQLWRLSQLPWDRYKPSQAVSLSTYIDPQDRNARTLILTVI